MKRFIFFTFCIFVASVLIAQSAKQTQVPDPPDENKEKIELNTDAVKGDDDALKDSDKLEIPLTGIIDKWNVYPNPADDHIFVEYTITDIKDLQISIVNHIGQIVIHEKVKIKDNGAKKQRLDISKLQPGIYFINIKAQNSKQLTKRLVIR